MNQNVSFSLLNVNFFDFERFRPEKSARKGKLNVYLKILRYVANKTLELNFINPILSNGPAPQYIILD